MRILFYCSSLGLGHKLRTAEIMKMLSERGHECHLCIAENKTNKYLKYYKISEIKGTREHYFKGNNYYHIGKIDLTELIECYECDAKVLRKIKPNLIISDWRFTTLALSNKYSIPLINLCNYCWIGLFTQVKELNIPFLPLVESSINDIISLQNKLVNHLNIPNPLKIKPVLNIVLEIDEITSVSNKISDCKFVGPVFPIIKYLDRDSININNRKLCIHFGGHSIPKILKDCYMGLYQNGFSVKETKLSKFKNRLSLFPENMINSSCVITHGGSGSIYQSLSVGKPIIIIPQHIEHEINANLFVKDKVAVLLNSKDLTNEKIIVNYNKLVEKKIQTKLNNFKRLIDVSQSLSNIENLIIKNT